MAITTRKKKTVVEEAPMLAPEVGYDEIAARAFEIHASGEGGDPMEDWLRAEQELHAERGEVMPIAA